MSPQAFYWLSLNATAPFNLTVIYCTLHSRLILFCRFRPRILLRSSEPKIQAVHLRNVCLLSQALQSYTKAPAKILSRFEFY